MIIPANIKPANKADAYQTVRDIVENHGDPVPEELYKLMLYFAPKPGAKAKNVEDWVAAFAATKDVRYCLNYVYSDGTRLTATCGGALAFAPTTRPEGYYNPKTLDTVKVDTKYPEIDRVIPARTEEFPIEELINGTAMKGKVTTYPIGPAYFDVRLMAKVLRAPGVITMAEPTDERGAVRGTTQFGTFVIMPTRW